MLDRELHGGGTAPPTASGRQGVRRVRSHRRLHSGRAALGEGRIAITPLLQSCFVMGWCRQTEATCGAGRIYSCRVIKLESLRDGFLTVLTTSPKIKIGTFGFVEEYEEGSVDDEELEPEPEFDLGGTK